LREPAEFQELRRNLHRLAEPSGREEQTAGLLVSLLRGFDPDELRTGLGGYGIAAVFAGPEEGPRVLIRAELDALPIPDPPALDHRSEDPDTAHKCGHDGHMAILAGLAGVLSKSRPAQGAAILLFQPAEETGQGAAAVLGDPDYGDLSPDMVFALHNLPGYPLGRVVVRSGPFASASVGLAVSLTGRSAHAAEPERGRSPALAVSQIIQAWSSVPQELVPLHVPSKVTVIHARVGGPAFGTTPGEGVVMATLRAHEDHVLHDLARHCAGLAEGIARAHGLEMSAGEVEPFPATVNDPSAVDHVRRAAGKAGLAVEEPDRPFGWSEDFGHFTARRPGALFGLGAGVDCPALHHPSYDFPDDLLVPGVRLLTELVREVVRSPVSPGSEGDAR